MDRRSHSYRSFAIRQHDSLRTACRTYRIQAQQIDNYLPIFVTISSKTMCFGCRLSTIPFLYLLLRVHVYKCWQHCKYMTISVLFTLFPVKGSGLQVLVPLSLSGNIHFIFSIFSKGSMSATLRLLHAGPLSLERSAQKKYGRTHTSQSSLCKMSLMTAGRTHTGPSSFI